MSALRKIDGRVLALLLPVLWLAALGSAFFFSSSTNNSRERCLT